MFKNPLKYQNGEAVQAREQVVSAISEIAQIPIEEVNSKLDQISQDQESIQLLSEALQAVQKGDERGYQVIKQMFNPQFETGVFAKGGKIQDFICKHAKGGNVNCNCENKTEKYQNPAGPIGRRQALDAAKTNYGFNDSQSRIAYANAKSALRSQGLRGSELRQRARQMLMEQLSQETRRPLLAAVDAPQSSPAYSVEDTPGLAGGTSEQQQLSNYRQVQDYSGSDFNTAFGNARSAYMNNNGPGLFRWNGNLYNTDLGSGSNAGGSNSNSNRNERFSVWNNEYTRSGLGREEAMERAADKYGVVLFDKEGGMVNKAKGGIKINDSNNTLVNRKAGKTIENGPFVNDLIGQKFLNFSNISSPSNTFVSAPTLESKIANVLRNSNLLSREEGLRRLESVGIPRFIGQDFGKTRRFLEIGGISK